MMDFLISLVVVMAKRREPAAKAVPILTQKINDSRSPSVLKPGGVYSIPRKRNTPRTSNKTGPLPLSNPNGSMRAIKERIIRIIAISEIMIRLCPSVPGKKAAMESRKRKASLVPAGIR
jgi:hypothetical protein